MLVEAGFREVQLNTKVVRGWSARGQGQETSLKRQKSQAERRKYAHIISDEGCRFEADTEWNAKVQIGSGSQDSERTSVPGRAATYGHAVSSTQGPSCTNSPDSSPLHLWLCSSSHQRGKSYFPAHWLCLAMRYAPARGMLANIMSTGSKSTWACSLHLSHCLE